MTSDEDSERMSQAEPEIAEGEPLPEPEEMSRARPFPHELPQPMEPLPESPKDEDAPTSSATSGHRRLL